MCNKREIEIVRERDVEKRETIFSKIKRDGRRGRVIVGDDFS